MADARGDISEGARELVDLSAEGLGSLGVHLAQIGDLIGSSVQPPKKGERNAATKIADKLELYKAYSDELNRRKAETIIKMEDDFKRLREWRKQAGTEGATLIEEMEIMYAKVREQGKMIEHEQNKVAHGHDKSRMLIRRLEVRDRKKDALAIQFNLRINAAKRDMTMRAVFCSWIQCAFDEVRFRWKDEKEKEKLKIEHHRKMRKSRAQARLDVVKREREKRVLQACFLSMQEETIECRAHRHIEELRRRFEDKVLILEAQVAQALGDEEAAKKLVNEMVTRIEEAKAQAREFEKKMKNAQKEARDAMAETERIRIEKDTALAAQAAAEKRADIAEANEREARAAEADANARADASDAARIKAQAAQRKAEEEVKKKQKKIQSLQRMLAELGAESDSDAPPDERPPAFFVNEDGSKAPRPRTRKERMGMAYREAESSRFELRLGMAAMVDKDTMSAMQLDRIRLDLETSAREVAEVRSANKALHADIEAVTAVSESLKKQSQSFNTTQSTEYNSTIQSTDTHAPMPDYPMAASSAAVSAFDPSRPVFAPAPLADPPGGSPRLLMKTASQPIIMPSLFTSPDSKNLAVPPSPGRQGLAPLRKIRRPPLDWHVGWH